jgi:hypothetical protein
MQRTVRVQRHDRGRHERKLVQADRLPAISINVEKDGGHVFGHADLFTKNGFKGRICVGKAGGRTREVRDKLRCLAKAKVDVWATLGSATVH